MPFADPTHLARAAQAVDDLLAHLSGDDWMAPTLCTGWSVADVTRHLVDVNLTFAQQIRSADAETLAGTSTPGDLLDSYRRSTDALQQALTGTAKSATDIAAPLRSRLALRVADLLIHGWDIAAASGKPLHLAEDLCAEALTFAQSRVGPYNAAANSRHLNQSTNTPRPSTGSPPCPAVPRQESCGDRARCRHRRRRPHRSDARRGARVGRHRRRHG